VNTPVICGYLRFLAARNISNHASGLGRLLPFDPSPSIILPRSARRAEPADDLVELLQIVVIDTHPAAVAAKRDVDFEAEHITQHALERQRVDILGGPLALQFAAQRGLSGGFLALL